MFAVEIYAAVRKFDFIEGNSRREAAREFGLSPTQNSKSQINPGASPAFKVLGVSPASSEPVKNLPPLAIQMRHLSFCVSGTSRNPLR
jgi:hypothetical protein